MKDIPQLLSTLIRWRRSLQSETAAFQTLRHNRDLCSTIQRQIETALNAYAKFSPVVYDMQGFSDDGVDVAVRLTLGEGSGRQIALVGYQLKSFDDSNSKDFYMRVKAQHDDAFRKVKGLSQYSLVLCTDETIHKDLPWGYGHRYAIVAAGDRYGSDWVVGLVAAGEFGWDLVGSIRLEGQKNYVPEAVYISGIPGAIAVTHVHGWGTGIFLCSSRCLSSTNDTVQWRLASVTCGSSLYIRMNRLPLGILNTPFIPLRDKTRPFCDFWRNSIDLYERIEQGSL